MDGHPEAIANPGSSFNYQFNVNQRAGLSWYHPHPDRATARQAFQGHAGLFIINDAEEASLNLPSGFQSMCAAKWASTSDRLNKKRLTFMITFNFIANAISIAGSAIIIWGVIRTLLLFLSMEWNKLLNKQISHNDEKIRYGFGSYLLLGLDFMLAADMIHTIHNPVLNELYILAIIVAIRSVISFFLHKEIDSEKTIK